MHRADTACAHTKWQHFSEWNDVTAATLKVWHEIENQTLSIFAYLLEEQSYRKFLADPTTWNDGALGFFEEHLSKNKNKKNNNKNKMSSDMGSVPDQKIIALMFFSSGDFRLIRV